mmetsp:Transcript_35693/g.77002  ORF Transcript_35693/g.77002 Transcript_35693/m.77002 type:complete len:275 (-) Transcript_35693:483-1307(-)
MRVPCIADVQIQPHHPLRHALLVHADAAEPGSYGAEGELLYGHWEGRLGLSQDAGADADGLLLAHDGQHGPELLHHVVGPLHLLVLRVRRPPGQFLLDHVQQRRIRHNALRYCTRDLLLPSLHVPEEHHCQGQVQPRRDSHALQHQGQRHQQHHVVGVESEPLLAHLSHQPHLRALSAVRVPLPCVRIQRALRLLHQVVPLPRVHLLLLALLRRGLLHIFARRQAAKPRHPRAFHSLQQTALFGGILRERGLARVRRHALSLHALLLGPVLLCH